MSKMMTLGMVWIVALLGLSACNTVAGVGEDVEAAGDAMEDSAERHKKY